MAKKDTDIGGVTMGTSFENDPGYDRVKAKQEKSEKAKNVLRGAGYARGGGVSPVKAVHKHESHLHKGAEKTKFKHGGKIDGKMPHARADKFARGGSAPKGHHTKISINLGAGQAEKQQALATGVALGKRMGAMGARPGVGAPMQARAPMPGAGGPMSGPSAMPPGGGPPMANRGGRFAKGGKVQHLTAGAGAGGGAGRLAKIKAYGPK